MRGRVTRAEPASHPFDPSSPAQASHHPHPTPLSRLVTLLGFERSDITVALIYGAVASILALAAPVGVQALVNAVAFGGLMQPVVMLVILVFGALAFAAALRAVQALVIERVQQRIFARVAVDLGRRLPRVRLDAFDGGHGPELINRFFDVLTVQKVAASLLVDGAAIVLSVIAGAVVLAFYHPLLLAFDVALVALVLLILFGLGRRAIDTSIAESRAKYAVAAWLEEMARHPSSFRCAAGTAFGETRADDLTRGYLTARRDHYRVLFRQIVASLALQAIATAALLGVGGGLVVAGRITLGQLVAAELIVTWSAAWPSSASTWRLITTSPPPSTSSATSPICRWRRAVTTISRARRWARGCASATCPSATRTGARCSPAPASTSPPARAWRSSGPTARARARWPT